MTLPEIVYDIKSIIHGGKIPDDTIFDNRLIAHWVDTQRALWLTNEYNKGVDIENNEVQILKKVEFDFIDASEIDMVTNVNILRSTVQIPRTLSSRVKDLITGIRGLNVSGYRFNYVRREQAIYSGNGFFNRYYIYLFKHNDYLYIKYGNQNLHMPTPTSLRIEGVFESPLKVDTFNNTVNDIWTGVTQYPISARFIQYIKGELIKADVTALFSVPKDNINDDEFNNKQSV